ncbi:MAG: FAD-dependent oxidoreductase [Deltaproteobacteria bacterium]|nr:FAD-dependent oxidoreductase [Deltaproteobacteria bacterium]
MEEAFDVAIVGAGPAGIAAACCLADQGVKTIVIERGEYPGAKNISGGVLYGHDLARILPDFDRRNCPIERNIIESRIWFLSKDGGYSLSYRDRAFAKEKKLNSFTVGRAKFDRWFSEQAREKGALVVCGTVVTDLLRDHHHRVIGIRTDRADGDVLSKVVLLTDGINSPLAAKTGFRPEPGPHQVALAVKEVIELSEEVIQERFNVGTGNGVTIEIVGEVTQGMDGVAVIYTNRKSLSLCLGANLATFSRQKVRPYEMMESFKEHPMVAPLIQGGKPAEYMAHWIAEGGYDAIPRLCGDGFLIAGDSAMLFNALHREGSNLAMISGRFAAEAILEAREKGDFGRNGLSGYLSRLHNSYIFKDLKKYRKFGRFLHTHEEIFTTLPAWTSLAAREMLTVNGVPKKDKQKALWREFRNRTSLLRVLKLLWEGWRGVT